MRKMFQPLKPILGVFALVAAIICILGGADVCMADDIDTTVTTAASYWTAIKTVAIGVVLFVIGRRLLKKL